MSAPICEACALHQHDSCFGVVRIGKAVAMCDCHECGVLAAETGATS